MAQDKNYLKLRFARTGAEPTAEDFGNLIDSIPADIDVDQVATQAADRLKTDQSFIKEVSPNTTNDLNAPSEDTILTTLGTKTALQQIQDDYNQKIGVVSAQASTAIVGEATLTMEPVDTTGVFRKYSIKLPGTYVNFLDTNGAPIEIIDDDPDNDIIGDLSKGIVELWGENGVWSKHIQPISLLAYAKSGDTSKTLYDVDQEKADKASVQSPIDISIQKFEATGMQYTDKGKSYDPLVYNSLYLNPTGFNGWDTPVGAPKNFNCTKFKFKTQTTPPTEVWVRVTEINNAGAVLAEKHLSDLALDPNVEVELSPIFDSIIENITGKQLRFMFVANQFITRYGHNPNPLPYNNTDYALATYKAKLELSWQDFKEATSTGTDNYANYVEFQLVQDGYKASQSLIKDVTSSVAGLDDLPVTNEKVDLAINKVIQVNGEETVTSPFSTFLNNSTFSGFGSGIGVKTGFTIIQSRLGARSTPITKVYWELRANAKDGTILKSGTLDVIIDANTFSYINVFFDEPYNNVSGVPLWFGVQANQLANDWGTNSGTLTGQDPAYTTNGALNRVWSVNTRPAWQVWANVGTYETIAEPTVVFAEKVGDVLNLTGNYANIILQEELYALEDHELNLYFDNIIETNIPLSALDIDVTCTKGAQLERGYRLTPVEADAGIVNISISVSYNEKEIANYNGRINIAPATAGAGATRKVNFWGDSTESGGQSQLVIISENDSDVMDIEFVGTLGTHVNYNGKDIDATINRHEGRGGYKISDYATVGRTLYKFPLTAVSAPPYIGSVYSTNGSSYSIVEVNITNGDGYVSATRTSGSNDPTANGILTNVSGPGAATLNYTGFTVTSANPLWDGTKVNYANYLSTNGILMSAGDIMALHLGINDVFHFTDDASLNIQLGTMVQQLRNIIASAKEAVPGLVFAVMVPICPAISQDAAGKNYGCGQTLYRYLRNIRMWQKRLLLEFDSQSERDSGTYLVPFNATLDRVYNMQKALVNANARNTVDKVDELGNFVHPAQFGYDQMGDTFKPFIKAKG